MSDPIIDALRDLYEYISNDDLKEDGPLYNDPLALITEIRYAFVFADEEISDLNDEIAKYENQESEADFQGMPERAEMFDLFCALGLSPCAKDYSLSDINVIRDAISAVGQLKR